MMELVIFKYGLVVISGIICFAVCRIFLGMVVKLYQQLLQMKIWFLTLLDSLKKLSGELKLPMSIRLVVALAFFVFGMFIIKDVIISLIFAVGGLIVPSIILNQIIQKTHNRFEEQLVDALSIISSSIRSGASLLQALEKMVKETNPPISTLFSEILNQTALGIPVDIALKGLANRVQSKDLHLAVVVMNVTREFGGNLAENLLKISDTIRERKKIQNKIAAITAQGRMSAWIITIMPFLLLGILNFMEPQIFGVMFKTTAGKIFILISLVLVSVGNYFIKKIVTIDI